MILLVIEFCSWIFLELLILIPGTFFLYLIKLTQSRPSLFPKKNKEIYKHKEIVFLYLCGIII